MRSEFFLDVTQHRMLYFVQVFRSNLQRSNSQLYVTLSRSSPFDDVAITNIERHRQHTESDKLIKYTTLYREVL